MCLSKIYSISTIFSPFPPMLIALTTEYSANRRTSFQQQKREGKLWELECNFNFISTGCILLPFYILFGHYNITAAACLILNFPKEEGGKERERESASAEFAKEVSGNSAFIIIIKITIGFLIRLHQQQLRKGFVECLHYCCGCCCCGKKAENIFSWNGESVAEVKKGVYRKNILKLLKTRQGLFLIIKIN